MAKSKPAWELYWINEWPKRHYTALTYFKIDISKWHSSAIWWQWNISIIVFGVGVAAERMGFVI